MSEAKMLRHAVVSVAIVVGLLVAVPSSPAFATECDVSVLIWGGTTNFLFFTTGFKGYATGILNCYDNRKVAGVIVAKVKVLPAGEDADSRKCDDFVWCQADVEAAGPKGDSDTGNCVVGEAEGAVVGGVEDHKNRLSDWDYFCTEVVTGRTLG